MIKDYWRFPWDYAPKNDCIKVRGTLDGKGGFLTEGTFLNINLNYQLGQNIFETELECMEALLRNRKDKVEQLRLEIDELEIKIDKIKWPR